jgi:hypothetical protein
MQIVVNEQLKDAIEWTCKYANEYKVDIDIHIDADGEVSVSVCPTYRDTADTPQTDLSEEEFVEGMKNLKMEVKQTDCDTCKHYKLACELFSEVCKYEPTTQTETQNSNLTFENRTMLDCYNCKRYKSDDACVECRYEPKADTPQTDCGWGEPK